MSGSGRIEAILIGSTATEEPRSVASAVAVAGRGLAGDRYHDGVGTWTDWRGITAGQALTLVEAEALEAAAEELGLEVTGAMARRNVVTRGVSLDALVGQRFRIGEVDCAGDRPCDPCRHLERLTAPGLLGALSGRGGLRADLLGSGTIRVGDAVSTA